MMKMNMQFAFGGPEVLNPEAAAKEKALRAEAKRKKRIKNLKKAAKAAGEGVKKLSIGAEKLADDSVKLYHAIKAEISEDVAAVRERDPAARSNVEVLLLYSGVHAILAYRVAHKLYLGRRYFSARAISQLSRFCTGIEIHPGATIGHGLFIDHGAGVVIGETCEIGDHCTLYQGVTLGGTGKDIGKRHPTLGDNVMVGAGAKVLGPFRIGDNAKIAAGAVVLKEIPENCTAVGIPARVVRRGGVKVEEDVKPEENGAGPQTEASSVADELDQIHVPDPVAQQLTELEARIRSLEAELAAPKAADGADN